MWWLQGSIQLIEILVAINRVFLWQLNYFLAIQMNFSIVNTMSFIRNLELTMWWPRIFMKSQDCSNLFDFNFKPQQIHLKVFSSTSNTLSVSLCKSTCSIWPFELWIAKQKPRTNHRWKWIILSLRSLNGFEEKLVATVIELEFFRQTSNVFFQKCTCTFSSYALSDWQVSDCDWYL